MPSLSSVARLRASEPSRPSSDCSTIPFAPTSKANSASRERRIGSWELLRCIHHGHYADVHLARPAGAIQHCADYVVKVLHRDLHQDVIARELMNNEAAAGRVTRHPHLATVLEAHTRSAPCHLVLPRFEGVTLAVLLRERQCGIRRALRCVRQTAEALAELHDHGWRHGDVKPANIIVSPDGHATLIDLSMASHVKAPLRGIGTPSYAAPETEMGVTSRASDIYALGAVLFELLAGSPPYAGDTPRELMEAHRHAPVPDLQEAAPGCPVGVTRLIRWMMQKPPHDRPSAEAAINELTALEIEAFANCDLA